MFINSRILRKDLPLNAVPHTLLVTAPQRSNEQALVPIPREPVDDHILRYDGHTLSEDADVFVFCQNFHPALIILLLEIRLYSRIRLLVDIRCVLQLKRVSFFIIQII